MVTTELGEAELEILCKFLRETVASLLAVNKDLLNHELHAPEKLDLLKQFAADKSHRSLVVAKIEKPSVNASVDGVDTTASNKDASGSDSLSLSSIREGNIQIHMSTKIEYLGPNAQTIAFLKREDFAKLDLTSGMDLDKVLEAGIQSQDSTTNPAGDHHTDLSSQIQIINLGYLGQDSNIFELASTYFDYSFMPLFTDYKNKTQVSNSGGDQSQGA